jgi:uncharacterized protein (DUF362 family)
MDPKELTRRQLLREAAGLAAAASAGAVAGCNMDMLFPNAGGQWASAIDPLCAAEGDDGGADAEAGTPAGTSAAPLTSAGDSGAGADGGGAPLGPTVVSVERDDSVILNTNPAIRSVTIDAAVVQSMLDTALSTLAGSVDNPWKVLLPDYAPGMRIGLKVNGLNQTLGTHAELVAAVINSLVTHLGVDPTKQVIVWELFLSYLTNKPGYSSAAFGGAQILGTTNSPNDSNGPGFRLNPCAYIPGSMGNSPRLSNILVEMTDVTINMPVLKTHNTVSGVTGALKNAYGMIDIPGSYHGSYATQAIPQVFAMPPIRKSMRLTILDGLQAVIWGATSDYPNAVPKTILVSQDPVAMDSYEVDFINHLCDTTPTDQGTYYPHVDSSQLGWLPVAEALGLGKQAYNLVTA